jgi:hypothetical protein
MDPFNIRIKNQEQDITFTVLPGENGCFKIIYYAAVLTAVQKRPGKDWMIVSKDDIEAGDLPFYIHTNDSERLQPTLDREFIQAVGSAIELELSQQD